ncbi:hypothetical protein B0T10DRAFT_554411 [Thelonectria olida]|uniref:Uncharacterized protein n=1 Tax=Thelonectria olida TaxID=1576542 RepID=A0A9P8WHZ1_9HYPO|nr:hypothetical protein B0T10DRAFT_554411 [Thelonectria olida]
MAAPLNHSNVSLNSSSLGGQRRFKKHKVLPRPHNDRGYEYTHSPRAGPKNYDLTINTSRPAGRDESFRIRGGTQPSSPRTLKHQPRKIGSGPDLPPTPPRHSRKSSSNSSGLPSSPTFAETTFQTPRNAGPRPPATPPNQRSPPTPDVTPPHNTGRPGLLRPALGDRNASKHTTGGSHTSFKTAREEPFSSEDEEKKSAVTKASVSTVRHISDKRNTQPPLTGLGLALASLAPHDDNRVSRDFNHFDGDWSSVSEVEEEWDNNLMRMVTIKKRPETVDPIRPISQAGIIIDPDMVSPTQAAKAVRHMPLHRKPETVSSTKGVSDRTTTSTAPSSAATSVSSDKRASAISMKSTKSTKSSVSTVVEAILMDGPPLPQRQRTLRHMRKQVALRAPINNSPRVPVMDSPRAPVMDSPRPIMDSPRVPLMDSPTLTANSVRTEQTAREPRFRRRPDDAKVDSYVSTTTSHSISSNKARREVWKNGGIPVVIVPDRRSSNKSRSRERSLRSRSSKRTPSVGSVPRDGSTAREAKEETKAASISDTNSSRPSRRGRAQSVSDRSERTIDFPPVIPARSSSLSAPTSRNASRAGSLTSESIRLHNALQESLLKKPEEEPRLPFLRLPDDKTTRVTRSTGSDKEASNRRLSSHNSDRERRLSSDRQSDKDVSQRRLSSHNSDRDTAQRRLSSVHSEFLNVKSYGSLKTPFSLASVETNGTALEVSEAMAVQMYPHQNSSVLMVDHTSKPSQSSIETPQEDEGDEPIEPNTETKDLAGDGPLTPPQPLFSFDDVDSPLRNPRAPPEPPSHPPAIHFIPATPSGMTPADERMITMGNYFESMKEKPGRRPSIVRRALNRRRRHSVDYPPTAPRVHGLITRTLSLSRHVRHGHARSPRSKSSPNMEHEPAYPSPDDDPAEGNKLHPFWRPLGSGDEDDYDDYHHGPDELDEVYRYPPINNRPHRNISKRMKRTFAILPPREEEYYADDQWGTERRTIRRTPSGNLRVMRHRSSLDSLRRTYHFDGGYQVVGDGTEKRPFWRRNSVHRRVNKEKRRHSLGSKLEEIQNIPRKISEKRREKRTRELRQKISGPREVRDGVGEVIRSRSLRDQYHPDRQI